LHALRGKYAYNGADVGGLCTALRSPLLLQQSTETATVHGHCTVPESVQIVDAYTIHHAQQRYIPAKNNADLQSRFCQLNATYKSQRAVHDRQRIISREQLVSK